MLKSRTVLSFAITILLFSCSQSGSNQMEKSEMADSTSSRFISSSAAVEPGKDTSRKFIRTADLKFKVKSVIKSTYDIENITNLQGGFVTYTNLTSEINNVTTIPVSADSSLETTYYTVSNSIMIRVPNTKLDTTLKDISRNIDFLDYRIIKADDVALVLKANNLTQERSAKNEERLKNAIDTRGKKLNETTNAEEVLLSKQEQADNAKILNLSLTDQIKFSTVNLTIYQRPTLKRELISNDKNITAYEPRFGSKIIEALISGWTVLESFIVFIARLWGLILFGFIVYVIYWKYGKKRK